MTMNSGDPPLPSANADSASPEELTGAFAFPFAKTGEPLATTSVARLVERIVPASAIVVGAARGAHR
jgi:hypothetical protein